MTFEAKHCFSTGKKLFKSLFFNFFFQGEKTRQNSVHFLNHLASHDAHWVLEFRFLVAVQFPLSWLGCGSLLEEEKEGKKWD